MRLSEGNILNLENILRDPRYSSTVFVMIHGGYPYEHQAIWLAAMKNVYLDTSLMELDMYPSEFRHVLKTWLETFPDKITFGTDSFPYNETLGAEESYWLGVQSARSALAAALAEMISEGEVSEAQALQIGAWLSARQCSWNLPGKGTLRWQKQKRRSDAGREPQSERRRKLRPRIANLHAVRIRRRAAPARWN